MAQQDDRELTNSSRSASGGALSSNPARFTRDRDTTEQDRVAMADVVSYFNERL